MDLYEFDDYKVFVRKWTESRPKRGRGEFRRMSEHLRISSVAVSQIFRGERDLSIEQALALAKFLVLGPDEQDFFILLVEKARAGTKDLRQYFERKIEGVRQERKDLSKRVKDKIVLDDVAKARFYSNWYYSAVRMASSVPGLQDYDGIAKRLGLPPELVGDVAAFLLEQGLCVRDAQGLRMGPSSTMLSADSPFINNHRRNWRLKALENLQRVGPDDLFYSGLVSLSEKDVARFKEKFMALIQEFVRGIQDSPSETLACLNLDWFELKK
ncbi:MAG: TIGR02147 family protein [Bdellovibrionaceae bacterium]|nr:TIGR02147 family protein [Pseudobdellovibrionaceae bacterium]